MLVLLVLSMTGTYVSTVSTEGNRDMHCTQVLPAMDHCRSVSRAHLPLLNLSKKVNDT